MNREDVIRMAREAGIQHGFDSEGHWDGLTNETIIERNPDSEGTKAYRVQRIVEILEPFAALVAAAAVEREREAFPDLTAVINWLENGCDPKEAAKELRLYAAAIRARGETSSRGKA